VQQQNCDMKHCEQLVLQILTRFGIDLQRKINKRTMGHIVEFTKKTMFVCIDLIGLKFFMYPGEDIIACLIILMPVAAAVGHSKEPEKNLE
jgi:hypothetical protein